MPKRYPGTQVTPSYHHQEHDASMTAGVRTFDVKVACGTLEYQNERMLSVREKPDMRFLVDAGIYPIEPTTHRYVPEGTRFEITESDPSTFR